MDFFTENTMNDLKIRFPPTAEESRLHCRGRPDIGAWNRGNHIGLQRGECGSLALAALQKTGRAGLDFCEQSEDRVPKIAGELGVRLVFRMAVGKPSVC